MFLARRESASRVSITAHRFTKQFADSTLLLRTRAGPAYDHTALGPFTGTYVGCMFGDYMSLLRVALQQRHTGPVMTGAPAAVSHAAIAVSAIATAAGTAAAAVLLRRVHAYTLPCMGASPICRQWRSVPERACGVCLQPAGPLQRHRHSLQQLAGCNPQRPPRHVSFWSMKTGCALRAGCIVMVLHHVAYHNPSIQCALFPGLPAGILGGEAAAAVAAGINVMVWHETTVGICQLQVGLEGPWGRFCCLHCWIV